MKNNLLQLIKEIALQFDFDWKVIAAFIEVESGGEGFDQATGRLLIQFEPAWFHRYIPYAPSGAWSVNKVERQQAEWKAFNSAYAINKDKAMRSTSIGLGQLMGFHFERLGYSSVGEMWDDAKKGLHRQVWQICRFIETDLKLQFCIAKKDWTGIATIYNGSGFRELAAKYNRIPYDESMKISYKKFSIK